MAGRLSEALRWCLDRIVQHAALLIVVALVALGALFMAHQFRTAPLPDLSTIEQTACPKGPLSQATPACSRLSAAASGTGGH